MIRSLTLGLLICFLAGCSGDPSAGKDTKRPPMKWGSLSAARGEFKTKLLREVKEPGQVPEPPADSLRLIRYDAPAGKLAAYVSLPPKDGKKHPAILWVGDGFSNSIGAWAWESGKPGEDRSPSAFWKAGIVTMVPSFRGGAGNPGLREVLLGEVDDLLAAADWLAKQEYVDPNRIYLGGHGTGGTMVLLAAASTDRFRAVFAFGPADEMMAYHHTEMVFDADDDRELALRTPMHWLNGIKSPIFAIEGTTPPSKWYELRDLAEATPNPKLHCYLIPNATHDSILGPTTRLLADKVLKDTDLTASLTLTRDEVVKLFRP